MEKKVTYRTVNTYDTLNTLTSETKNVWIVFHGIGYLSRYFIRQFQPMNPVENYIIAPQAPAKYYKDEEYKRIGASWLTKENRDVEIENNLKYLDAIMEKEAIPPTANLIFLGYSQGVSIAARWIASRKIVPAHFMIISGAFPKELTVSDFKFLENKTQITHIVGERDPYFEKKNVLLEKEWLQKVLPHIQFIVHPGGHELNLESLPVICDF